MILQPVFSIFRCSSLTSGTCRTLVLSVHFFLCLPCLLPAFTLPCKMPLARPDVRETWPYHCSLYLFTMVGRSSCGPTACWILARTSSWVTWSFLRCVVSCGSISLPWFVFFFGALLWGFMIHKHTGRWMWQGSTLVVYWNWERYSCHSKLVSTLSMLLLSVQSWRVSHAWNPHQL